MKAMILAAGRGDRMRPLTDRTPKPLLTVHGTPLIEWHLQALARAGVSEVIINTAWLESQIVSALGDGSRFGVSITYSLEGRDHGGALETAGGLKKALPLLSAGAANNAPFWYVAGDVHAPDFSFDAELTKTDELAHLWMVPNPPQHPGGDFGVSHSLATVGDAGARYTWSGIGLFRPAFVTELMSALEPGLPAKLRPYLDTAIAQRRLGAEVYRGSWTDVGTPERLRELNAAAR